MGSTSPGKQTSHIFKRAIKRLTGFEHTEIVKAVNELADNWSEDRAPRLGASLAFYALLSAAPLLLVMVAVAAVAYGPQAARGQLAWEIRYVVGADRAKALQDLIQNAYHPVPGLIASAVGILTAVIGSTSVVVELRDALNTIWHVPPAANSRGLAGLLQVVKDRLYSFALVLAGGVFLVISVSVNATVTAMSRFLSSFLHDFPLMLQVAASVTSFLVVAVLFAAIYKLLPDVYLCWSDVAVGAGVTAFLFEIGRVLIGWYLGRSAFASTYGAAGSVVMLLVWVYYSAQVFFLGAEFTKAYTHARIVTGKRPRNLIPCYERLITHRSPEAPPKAWRQM